MLLNLVEDLRKERTSLPTASTTTIVKSEQMPSSVTPVPTKLSTSDVTKEDFETFKKEMFLLSENRMQKSDNVPTNSTYSSTSVSKEKQMLTAATPVPTKSTTLGVTKEDFESFKKEMFLISQRNVERTPRNTQSMNGE